MRRISALGLLVCACSTTRQDYLSLAVPIQRDVPRVQAYFVPPAAEGGCPPFSYCPDQRKVRACRALVDASARLAALPAAKNRASEASAAPIRTAASAVAGRLHQPCAANTTEETCGHACDDAAPDVRKLASAINAFAEDAARTTTLRSLPRVTIPKE